MGLRRRLRLVGGSSNNEALSVLAALCGFVIGLSIVRLRALRNTRGDAIKPVMLSCRRPDEKNRIDL
jgi:hypothetical protein